MAPILINVAASLAGNVIDGISEHFSHHHGVRKAGKTEAADFDAELAKTQTAASIAPPASVSVDPQSALVSQVLGRPELATALAGANQAQPVQVEMSAAGGVSLRSANGELHALKVSDDTRALVAKLYTAHQSGATPGKTAATAVLAIDPSHAVAPTWSNLPTRTA